MLDTETVAPLSLPSLRHLFYSPPFTPKKEIYLKYNNRICYLIG